VIAAPRVTPQTSVGGSTLGANSGTATGNYGGWFDYVSDVPVKWIWIINSTSNLIVVDNFVLG